MNQFIICQGFAKKGMQSVMLGAVLNIILDPVFIFLLDLGVKGAAIATVLSQLAVSYTHLDVYKRQSGCRDFGPASYPAAVPRSVRRWSR